MAATIGVGNIADTFNGLLAAPNLIALIVLAGVLAKEKNAYLAELRQKGEIQ